MLFLIVRQFFLLIRNIIFRIGMNSCVWSNPVTIRIVFRMLCLFLLLLLHWRDGILSVKWKSVWMWRRTASNGELLFMKTPINNCTPWLAIRRAINIRECTGKTLHGVHIPAGMPSIIIFPRTYLLLIRINGENIFSRQWQVSRWKCRKILMDIPIKMEC